MLPCCPRKRLGMCRAVQLASFRSWSCRHGHRAGCRSGEFVYWASILLLISCMLSDITVTPALFSKTVALKSSILHLICYKTSSLTCCVMKKRAKWLFEAVGFHFRCTTYSVWLNFGRVLLPKALREHSGPTIFADWSNNFLCLH